MRCEGGRDRSKGVLCRRFQSWMNRCRFNMIPCFLERTHLKIAYTVRRKVVPRNTQKLVPYEEIIRTLYYPFANQRHPNLEEELLARSNTNQGFLMLVQLYSQLVARYSSAP